MDQAAHSPATSCRNCGFAAPAAAAAPNYCAHCGQETAVHPPTFAEFVHEFIGHYIALEGALWRTLALLLFKPGRLTREYLAGRRRRYVLPLRLYLTISFVFFVAAKALPTPATPEAVPPELVQQLHKDAKTIQAESERNTARLQSMAPTVMFLLLPLFAGILHLAWRSRGMTYGEHFVCSLHLHSFWFVVLLFVDRLPEVISDWLLLLLPLYAVLAMREVYGARWPAVLGRSALIFVMYVAVLAAAVVGMLAWLKFTK
jgi:hypothetical protein